MTQSVLKLGELPAARYERKFLASEFSLEEVLSLVRMQPAGFSQVYPARWVNSIYLDTPNLRHYHVHVNGVPNRYKVRVRWYGDLAGDIAEPRLEFKVRHGLLGGKIVQPLSPFRLDPASPGDSLLEHLSHASLEESSEDYLKMLSPTLLNRYWRHYLLSQDGKFRLTLDTGLQFYNPEQPCEEIFNLNRGIPSTVIMELKYLPAYAQEANQITNGLPFRLTRCSKYVLGIEKRYGE